MPYQRVGRLYVGMASHAHSARTYETCKRSYSKPFWAFSPMFFYRTIPPKWLKCIARLTARKRLNFRFVHFLLLRLLEIISNGLRQNWLKLSLWLLHQSLSILCGQCLLLPECSYRGDSTRWKLEFPILYKRWTPLHLYYTT